MKNSKFFLTTLFAAAAMGASALAGDANTIKINFYGGDRAEGSEWNNMSGGTQATPQALNFTDGNSSGAAVAWSSSGNWNWDTATATVLKGYLDDGGSGISIKVSDISYLLYDVTIIAATDTGNGAKFSSKTVNGVAYTSDGNGGAIQGNGAWGVSQQTEVNNNNSFTISGLTGDLSISSVRADTSTVNRGCIAGIQIVNTYTGTAASATLDADAAWTTTQLGSATWTNSTAAAGTYADVTLSADVNLSASAGIVADGIVVSGGHTLTLSAAEGNTAGIDLIGPGVVRVASGSTLSLASGTVLNFKSANSSITGAISGAGKLVAKSGATLGASGATLTGFTGTLSTESGAAVYLGNGLAGLNWTSKTYALDFASDATLKLGLSSAWNSVKLGQTNFAGRVNITAGQFTINESDIGDGTWVLDGGVILRQNGTTVAGSTTYDSASGITTINNDMVVNSGTVEFRVNAGSGSGNGNRLIYAGDVSGAGTLNKVNGGIVDFTGSVSLGGFTASSGTTNFTGTSVIVGGIIETKNGAVINQSSGVANAQRLVLHNSQANGADTYNLSGGVLNITSTSTAAANTAAVLIGHWGANGGTSSGALNLSGTGVLNVANGSVSASHSSSGSISVSGNAELNAYVLHLKSQGSSSSVTVSENGRLNLGAGGFDNTSATNVLTFDGGTLGTFADAFSSSDAVSLGANGIIVDTEKRTLSTTGASSASGAAASITLNGVLSDASGVTGSLTKRGAGMLTLGGANNYTGATTVEAGTLKLANADALGSGLVTVKDGATLKRGIDGTVNIGGGLTTEGAAILDLGAVSADSAAISATGAVTISSGTIFDMTEASAGLKLVSGSSVAADGLSIANVYVGGALVNQRGTATFTVENNTLVLSAYTAGGAWNISWNGGDAGVWKINGDEIWTKTDDASVGATFQTGDSVTFATAGAQVTVEGAVNPAAIAVAENTTFKGTDAAVNVANGSLAFSNDAKLEIQNGVTLDFGAGGGAIGSSASPLALSGDGTVKYSFTTTSVWGGGTDSGVFIADTFEGTVDYSGCLNWYDGAPAISLGENATLKLSNKSGQTDAALWGSANAVFAHKVVFGTDYGINVSGGSLTLEGVVDAAGKTLTVTGGNTLAFAGAANVGTLNISGGKVAVTGTGALSATISNLAAGATLELAGTGDRSEITLSGSTSISGNLTIGNATVDASGSGDIFNYGVGQTQTITLNAGGELALGAQRQSFCSNVDFVLNGGKISGTGENNNGYALDFFQSNTISVTDDSEISANLCMRGGNDKTLAIDVDADKTLTFSGKIVTPAAAAQSTNAVLEKQGAGTLVLSGANTYDQGTRITAGTLVAKNASALGTGAVTVSSGATLEHGVAGDATLNTGALTFASGSVLNLGTVAYNEDGMISVTGDVSIDAGATICVDNLLLYASLVKASGTMSAAAENASLLFLGLDASGDRRTLSVVDGNTLLLSAEVYELTWNGGEEGFWRANGTGWDHAGADKDFQNGDTATFSGDVAANVTLDGAVALGVPVPIFGESSGISMTVGSGADDAADYAFTGTNGAQIRANGKFVKQGTGTAKFTDVDFSEFTGNFEATAGTLEFAYSEGEEGVVASRLTGGATLKVSGAGKLTLSGADTAHGNELSGGVVIDGGTLSVNSTAWGGKGNLGTLFSYAGTELKNGGVIEVTEAQLHEDDGYSWRQGGARRGFSVSEGTGTYRYAGTADSVITQNEANQQIGVADGAVVNFDVVNAETKLTVTKAIAKNTDSGTEDSTGKVAKSGAGTLVLDPNSVHYAGVILNAGVLEIASADALGTGKILEVGSGADMTLRGAGASALTLGSDVTISYRADSGELAIDNVAFDGTTLYLADVANNTALFSGYTGGDGEVNNLFTITGVVGSGLNLISRDGTIYFFNQKNLNWAGAADAVWSTDSSLLNWTSLDAPGTFAFANDDRVTFAVDGASVTVEGEVLPDTVKVSAATTFAGTGTVTLASSDKLTLGATLTLGEGVTLKFTNAIGSNEALSDYSKIAGTGTFAFASSVSTASTSNGVGVDLSNFSGDVYLTGGRLLLGNDTITSSFGSASLRVASGAELSFNGSGTDIANAVMFEGDSAIHANSGKSGTLSGNVTATAGTLTKKGAGTLTLSGASDISVLDVNAGSVTFAKSAATGAPANAGTHVVGRLAGGGTVTVNADASLTINGAEASTIGSLAGAGAVTKSGTGDLTISGAIGGVNLAIDAGTLIWAHGANQTTSADIVVAEGATLSESANYKYHATFTGALSGSGTLVSRVPTNGSGQNDGWRKITLSGSTANFTGEWQLESAEGTNGSYPNDNRHVLGILNSSDGVFGGAVNFTSTNADSAKISSKLVLLKDMEIGGLAGELERTSVVGASAVSDDIAGNITTANRALRLNVKDGADYSYAGTIDASISTLTKTGAGTQVLTNAGNAFAALEVSGGTLAATNVGALGAADSVTLTDGTLELRGVSGAGNDAAEFAKSLTGAGTFALTNTSKVAVAADKLSGFTGTLNVADEASTLQVLGAATVGAKLDGAGTFEKLGDGTLALSAAAAADRTGSTTVSAGTLALTNARALGSGDELGSVGVFLDGAGTTLELRDISGLDSLLFSNKVTGTGTFSLTGSSQLLTDFGAQLSNFEGDFDLGAGTRLNLGIDVDDVAAFGQFRNAASIGDGATLGIDAGAADAAFAMALSGTGTLEKLGTGTLTLAAAPADAFTGTLKIAAGTLKLDGTTAWILNNDVAGTGALEISGKITAHASKFTSEFTGATTVLENSELEIWTDTTGSLSTAVTGAGTLTKTGAGTLLLAADTAVKTVDLRAGGLAGVNLGSGQTLKVSYDDVTLSGANTLRAGTLSFLDENSALTKLTIADGTTTVGGDLKIDVNVAFPSVTNPSFETGAEVSHVNTYTLIEVASGATLDGWDTLTKDNFLVNGAAIESHRESVLTNVAPGQISLELKSFDLLWNGGNGVWNVGGNAVWTRADATGATFVETYMNSDRVTFAGTATVTLGADVAPQTIAVTGGGTLTLDCGGHAVKYGTTTIEDGSTLALKIGDAREYFASAVTVSGAGTLKLDMNADADLATLIAGTISGADGLTFEKAGTKTLTVSGGALGKLAGFTADNVVSVSAGTLVIEDGFASIGGAELNVGRGATAKALLTFDESLSNRISGAGTFVKQGAGTLTLSADSTAFSGSLFVDEGTVRLEDANGMGDAALGTDVTVNPDGTLVLAFSDAVYNKNFHGTGTIVADNGEKLTLRGGEGDFSGDLVVNGGLVSAQLGGSFGAGTIVFADADKAVEFKLTEAGAFAGLFSGEGTVTVAAGSKELTLSGDVGDVRERFAGTLKVEASVVAEHAEVLGSADATVEIGAAGVLSVEEGTLKAKLAGSGMLAKTTAETLTLANADNADFTGRIAVKEGALSVSDAAALGATRGVELSAGATLDIVVRAGETFTLDRAVTGEGDLLVRGDGDGTHAFVYGLSGKNFHGNMTFSGVSAVSASNFTADDGLLRLTNAATWDARGGVSIGERSVLRLESTRVSAAADVRTTSADSEAGIASTLTSGGFRASSGVSGSVELSGISATPTTTASGEAGAVLSFGVDSRPDARVAPIALSGDGSVTLNNVSVEVLLGGDLGSAFDISEIRLVDTERGGMVEGSGVDSATIVLADGSEVEYHYRNGWLTLEAVPTGMNLAYAAMVTLPTETFSQDVRSLHRRMEQRRFGVEDRNEWQFFAQAQTMSADTGSDKSDSATFDYSTYGALVGADVRVGESTLFGLALAYDRGTADIHDDQGEITSDAYRATLYAGTVFADYLYAEAGAHVGFASNEIDRKGDYDRNKGDADAWSAGAFATVGGVIPTGVDGFFLTPHVGVAYLTTHVESFEERGTSAMDVDSISADSLRASVGLGAQVAFDFGEVPTRFTLDVSYSRECLDDDVNAKIRTDDGSLTRTEKAFAEDVISVGAGLDFSLSKNTGVFLNYTADFGLNSDVTHRADAGFRFTW
ncbi:MAG: autotransporter-associated beta strand repeat-containing protein [Candidatus Spyradosoma sp.]